jgi:ADP-ribosylglycohydrolase
MLGAIIGDIVGSPYEFDVNNIKTKKFPLFSQKSSFTDDTVMTIAVADALLSVAKDADIDTIHRAVIEKMQLWGKRYPYAGYGARFIRWITEEDPQPYNSWGNGSAMRVSSVGWLYDSLERTLEVAKATAEVSHNHPEGIKGAQATAAAIYLARHGKNRSEIRAYIEKTFGYDFSRTCDEIRPHYRHVESCQETVPEAMTAVWEGMDFEDTIRLAVSLGGDSDTLTCIAGGIAEVIWPIPENIKSEALHRLSEDIVVVYHTFLNRIG